MSGGAHTRNLRSLLTSVEGLTDEQRRTFLLSVAGQVSGHVDPALWDDALRYAAHLVDLSGCACEPDVKAEPVVDPFWGVIA